MLICRTVAQVQSAIETWHQDNNKVALVPTMGNLHDGHIALLQEARKRADKVTASIFVNALQFDKQEDFDTYPRTERLDCERLRHNDTALVFVPDHDEMSPWCENHAEHRNIDWGRLANDLCGKYRNGHFQGVALVVKRLFEIFTPDIALFGEKDYQQLLLIKQLVKRFEFDVEIVAVPTVRDKNGLALSSRNTHLDATQNRLAPLLYQNLVHIVDALRRGERDFECLTKQAWERLEREGLHPDYIEVRVAETLAPPTMQDTELIVLAAVWLGKTRLIDNLRV